MTEKTCPCGLCGKPTLMLGTKRCDGCWELERRVRNDPGLARTILGSLPHKASASAEHQELAALRTWAAGQCTLLQVIETLGPMSLWSKAALDEHITKKVAEAQAIDGLTDDQLKERPLFMRGYTAGLTDAKRSTMEGLTDEQIVVLAKEHQWKMSEHYGATVFQFRLSGLLPFARAVLAASPVPMASSAGEPIELFEGYEVLQALTENAKRRTSAENVSDVLDAVVRLIRKRFKESPPAASLREQEDEKVLRDGLARQEILAALLKVLQEDAARLDWLDEKNKRFRMGWKVGMAPAGNVSVQSIIFAAKAMTPTPIREAIDAQRLGREKEQS